jgi:hypothetical protein
VNTEADSAAGLLTMTDTLGDMAVDGVVAGSEVWTLAPPPRAWMKGTKRFFW